jgi:uncharacterized alkaline shock family protein YloU
VNGDETDADAEAVQAAVRSVSSVVDLVGGMAGVATFLPGRRVDGVRLTPGEVEIHIAAGYDVPLPAVAQQVRERVLPLVGRRAVSVYIDDVRQPAGNGPA